jgi:hypothetical protein
MKKILVIVPLALLIVYWVAKSGGVDCSGLMSPDTSIGG